FRDFDANERTLEVLLARDVWTRLFQDVGNARSEALVWNSRPLDVQVAPIRPQHDQPDDRRQNERQQGTQQPPPDMRRHPRVIVSFAVDMGVAHGLRVWHPRKRY
ncbi:MAG: hypothetical protein ACREX8_16675, partial [Gammaproteobacteria bacterium]